MKPYVDIEGSGEGVTTITAAGNAGFTGTVVGADNAELRFLTVENTGETRTPSPFTRTRPRPASLTSP